MPGPSKFVGFALLIAALPIYPADVQAILRGIEKRYNNADTLTVNFTETYKAPPQVKTEKGVLYRRKGGRMRWEYTVPPGKLWISDGKDVISYEPPDRKAEQTPLKKDDDMRAPLAFLLGNIDFNRDFQQYETTPDGMITAKPRSDQFPYSEISFLPAANFAIVKLTVKLQGRAQIDYQFDGEKLNVPIDDKKFHFTPPPGVEVVKSSNSR